MILGSIEDGVVTLCDDGKPVVDAEPPEVGDGYALRGMWVDTGGTIERRWEVSSSKDAATAESIRADVEYMAMMLGVELPSMEADGDE